MRRKLLINSSLFITISFTSIIGVASCLNNNKFVEPTFKKTINQISDLNWNYEYLRAFRDEEYNDSSLQHNVWIKDEKIYENSEFKIYVEGETNKFIYLDLFNKKIKKWYLIKVSVNNLPLEKQFKQTIENSIITKIINEFSRMVTSKFSTDNIYLPLTSENRSTTIKKDGYGSFKSSWGVWNSTTRPVDFNFEVTKDLVRNQLLGQNKINEESVVIDKVKLNKLYYLPLIEIIDPPVGVANWTHKGITFNNEFIKTNFDNKTNRLKLPKGADRGQEWWGWFLDGGKFLWETFSSALINFGTILNSSPILDWASKITEAISIGDEIFKSIVVDTVNEEYIKNKIVIDNFSNALINNGYRVDLNKYLDLNSNNVINIWANIQYKAKSTAMFGNRTKAKIYEVNGLATSSIEWTEYVKK